MCAYTLVALADGSYKFVGLSQPNVSLMLKYYGFKTTAKGGSGFGDGALAPFGGTRPSGEAEGDHALGAGFLGCGRLGMCIRAKIHSFFTFFALDGGGVPRVWGPWVGHQSKEWWWGAWGVGPLG